MSTPPGTSRPPGSPVLLYSPSPPPTSPLLPPSDQRDSIDCPLENETLQHGDSNNAQSVSSNEPRSAFSAVLRLNNENHTVTTGSLDDHNAGQATHGFYIPTIEEVIAYQRDHPMPIISQSLLDSSSSLPSVPLLSEDSRSNTRLSAQEDSSSSIITVPLNEDSSQHSTASQLTVPVLNEDSNNALDTDTVSVVSAVTKAVGRRSASPADEPPAKVRKVSNSSDEADGESCPVCLEPWGNAGDHRLVALKCGHLFGSKCVERWLRAAPARDRSCPTCKSRASLKDLRCIYARRLVAADTAELSALQKRLRDLQAEKQRTELLLHQSKLATRACLEEIETLKLQRSALQPPPRETAPRRRCWRFALEKNLEISREGGCRVLAYNSRSYDLYVSQKSTSTLFPGWGVRKVSCVDFRPGQFQLLHPKPIRDAAYSSARDTLLTVGLDGCARLWQRGAAGPCVRAGAPLWACAWDADRDDQLYAGGVGGVVLQYDIRNPAQALARLQSPGQSTPVVALQSTQLGLLSCRLDSCCLWRPRDGSWLADPLPVEGPFISMTYDPLSRCALLSCRGRAASPRGKLVVCRLQADGGCAVEQSFPHSAQSSVMCRAAWVSADAGQARWAAAHAESEAALRLHPVTGAQSASLPAKEPALDVRSVSLHGETLLAALSDSRLRLYKAVATDL